MAPSSIHVLGFGRQSMSTYKPNQRTQMTPQQQAQYVMPHQELGALSTDMTAQVADAFHVPAL